MLGVYVAFKLWMSLNVPYPEVLQVIREVFCAVAPLIVKVEFSHMEPSIPAETIGKLLKVILFTSLTLPIHGVKL